MALASNGAGQSLANDVYASDSFRMAEKDPSTMSIESLLTLANNIKQLPDDPQSEKWGSHKLEKAYAMAVALNALSSKIDKSVDISRGPMANVPPPKAAGMPAGVCPSAIANPAWREEYIAALKANQTYATLVDQQVAVREEVSSLGVFVKKYMKNYFISEELEKFISSLETNKLFEKNRDEIRAIIDPK